MKKLCWLIAALACVCLVACAAAMAEGEWPESSHPYENNLNQSWTYQHPTPTDWLRVRFSDETETETRYDKITITSSTGNVTEYDGDGLAGAALYLPGDHFTITLTSDGSVNRYGFSFDAIEAKTQTEYEDEHGFIRVSAPPESLHPYDADTDITWIYTHPTEAFGLMAVFSAETETEYNYDKITITDAQGQSTAYMGSELKSKGLVLPGNHFSIRLTSDASTQKYGFSFTEIRALDEEEYDEMINSVFGTCGEGIIWRVDRRTGTMYISGEGPMEDYASEEDGNWSLWSPPYWSWDKDVSVDESRSQIKHVVIEEGVTHIGAGSMRDLDGLESISIPSTVTSIGGWAFDRSTAIEEIVLPAGLTRIEDSSFSDCHALSSINIPAGVQAIGPYAFYNTNISEITLPSSLLGIGEFAFCGSALTKIIIPLNVMTIGERAFYECTSLQNIYVSSQNASFKHVNGVLFTKDGTELIAYCPGRENTTYKIPSGVEKIRASAFAYSEALQEVDFPTSLRTIENWAFGHTGLTEVLLPQNLLTIDFKAFGACANLTEATMPVSLTQIGANVFLDCPLEAVYYEGAAADWDEIDVDEDNDDLMNATFYYGVNPYCPHTSLTYRPALAHTCTEDGYIAHWECDLCGNKFLDQNAFQRARDIVVPAAHNYESAVTTEPTCSETGVRTYTCTVCSASTEGHSYTETIPATGAHTYVGGYCVNLKRDGTVCGRPAPTVRAYGKCGYTGAMDNMISIVLYPGQSLNTDRLWGDSVMWTLYDDGTLRISGRGAMCTCIEVDRGNSTGSSITFGFISSPWYDYRSEIRNVIIDHGVTAIGQRCFYNCSSIDSIELPDTLTTIPANAFTGAGLIDHIYYHGTQADWHNVNNHAGLGNNGEDVAFLVATGLMPDLILPASLTEIGSEAFSGISARFIEVPATVTQIADDAFNTFVTLIVAADSYAETWAREHMVPYIPQ